MNKSVKIIIGILITILILWCIIFAVDYNRCSRMKEPIFTISKQESDSSIKTITYQGLGYKIEVEKNISNEGKEQITKIEMYMFNKFITGAETNIESNNLNKVQESNNKMNIEDLPQDYSYIKAIQDKCVILVHRNKIYNKNELDKFLKKVDKNEPYSIRCIRYTIEGDMIITDVKFEGNDVYTVCCDWTRDKFSSEQDRTYKYGKFSKLVIQEKDEAIEIYLQNKIGGDLDQVSIAYYNKNTKIINDYEFNYLLDVKKSKDRRKQKITVKDLSKKYDYDIYYYGLDSITIQINNENIDLRQALMENKVTMEEIIEQADKDSKNEVISSDQYKDGGTMIYLYDTYTIVKSHSLDGNRDVYIGVPEMRLDDVREISH